MNLLKKLNEVFNNNFNVLERVKKVDITCSISIDNIPTIELIQSIFDNISDRDTIEMILSLNNDAVADIKISKKTSAYEYESICNDAIELCSNLNLKITIDKDVVENKFSIYHWDSFSNDLLSRNFVEVLKSISCLIQDNKYLYFEIFDEDILLNTETLSFSKYGKIIDWKPNYDIDRSSILERSKEISSFYLPNSTALIPEDFKITKHNGVKHTFIGLFNKIESLLALTFISARSEFKPSQQFIYRISNIYGSENNIDVYKIQYNELVYTTYKWLFSGGNLIDKSIIMRDVINSYQDKANDSIITEDVFSSILSSYNLYLKDNAKVYIEMKGKLSDIIFDITNKLIETQSSFTSDIKLNIGALLTFILTVFVLNTLSGGDFEDAISGKVVFLFEIMLLLSIPYICLSILETFKNIDTVYKGYYNLKEIYENVLSKSDIGKEFEKKPFQDEVKNTKKQIICYSFIWGMTLILCGIILEMYVNFENYNILLNIFVKESK